jgi:tetratricopeptide (TPR) repeat protein
VTRRLLFGAVFAGFAAAVAQERPPEQEPPEEDESAKPKEYTFNPLQAETELRVGNFYFKKGSFRAAAKRFEEATRWNPTLAEAFLRWGDALEKLNDKAGARTAWAKFLELEPENKAAGPIRKKLKKT